MNKRFARVLGMVTLLGALTGVLAGGGAASAAVQCTPVTAAVLVCTVTGEGRYVVVYSDAVVVEAGLNYSYVKATGVLISEGLTGHTSGAVLYCQPADGKNHLAIEVNSATTDRKLPRNCT